MPTYGYRFTDEQGGEFEEFQHMTESAFTVRDGRPCERTVNAPKPHTLYGKGCGTSPIEMMSIAVDSEEEVDAFRRRNPGVEISRDRDNRNFGVPIAKSRSEKLRVLQNEGFIETN